MFMCMCVHVYLRLCVYACVLSGWCPGDLMANIVCFHGQSFQHTAHRNAEHTRGHTHTDTHIQSNLVHFNTYGVWVKSSANIQ